MSSTSFENMEKLSSEELHKFVTENDSSERKFKALHILEQRRMLPMIDAANKSASAAKYSAIAAGISAIIALAALFIKTNG